MRTLHSDHLMLVTDFDNTLTKRGHSVWEVLRNTLPEEGRKESDIERHHNMAKEHKGELTVDEIILWSKHELNRYAKYGITTTAMKEAAHQLKLRQGARKLFEVCANGGIESHILSASVMDAIEYVVKVKRLQATQVHSTHKRRCRHRME
jgi:phosphoserine phosphatase